MNKSDIEQNYDPLTIKKEEYELIKIIKFVNIIKKRKICEKCSKEMVLEKNTIYIDHYCWRCRSNAPKHDIRVNIRNDSKFENIRVPLNALYYMIYQCFLNRYSINKTYIEMKNFAEIMTISKISKKLDYKDILRTSQYYKKVFSS